MIDALISGGQTGADQGGLNAGQYLNISTGGYAPKGWKTEEGPCPSLEHFGLIECETDDYIERTRANVKLADGTIIFGRRSVGSNKTEEFCRIQNKPCCWVLWPSIPFSPIMQANGTYIVPPASQTLVRLWLKRKEIKLLNIAGNRESKNPGIAEFVKSFLIKALQ